MQGERNIGADVETCSNMFNGIMKSDLHVVGNSTTSKDGSFQRSEVTLIDLNTK